MMRLSLVVLLTRTAFLWLTLFLVRTNHYHSKVVAWTINVWPKRISPTITTTKDDRYLPQYPYHKTTTTSLQVSSDQEEESSTLMNRRHWIRRSLFWGVGTTTLSTITTITDTNDHRMAYAVETMTTTNNNNNAVVYERRNTINGFSFAYQLVPPPYFAPGNKPLKTHLDEVNFFYTPPPPSNEEPTTVSTIKPHKGYQYGITIDPVRINSLTEFGTPEEVAARVVLAEVNRDGIFDVTLMKDPLSSKTTTTATTTSDDPPSSIYYVLNYKSEGKRGTKRFVVKFYIVNQLLYTLTAQCKEDEYDELAQEIDQAAESFQVMV